MLVRSLSLSILLTSFAKKNHIIGNAKSQNEWNVRSALCCSLAFRLILTLCFIAWTMDEHWNHAVINMNRIQSDLHLNNYVNFFVFIFFKFQKNQIKYLFLISSECNLHVNIFYLTCKFNHMRSHIENRDM